MGRIQTGAGWWLKRGDLRKQGEGRVSGLVSEDEKGWLPADKGEANEFAAEGAARGPRPGGEKEGDSLGR